MVYVVTQAYNHSYLGGREREDGGSDGLGELSRPHVNQCNRRAHWCITCVIPATQGSTNRIAVHSGLSIM
jgi:hypothetical protein